MPSRKYVRQSSCRECGARLRVGEPCAHRRMESDGMVYLTEASGHGMEPDPYAEYTNGMEFEESAGEQA